MTGPVGAIIAAVVGTVLAIVASLGIVNSQTGATPSTEPFIVYGDS